MSYGVIVVKSNNTPTSEVRGWVYFIQAEIGGPIKIGWTRDADKRLKDLRSMNPFELVMIGRFSGMLSDERKLHEEFADVRLHGEWFEPVPDLIAVIDEFSEFRIDIVENTEETDDEFYEQHGEQAMREFEASEGEAQP